MKILLVDDDDEFLEQSKMLWERREREVRVDTFRDPEQALEKFENVEYDAVVADYKMPEMDGLELLRTIREEGYDTPFVILTGRGGEEVAMEAMNLKADRYIKKGTDPGEQFKVILDAIFERPAR